MLLRHAILIGMVVFAAPAVGQPQDRSAEPSSRGAEVTTKTVQLEQILARARALAEQRAASFNDQGMILQTPMRPAQDGARNLQPGQLVPRQPLPKVPSDQLRVPLNPSGRLVVKFRDDVKARIQPDGTLASVSGRDLTAAREIIQNAGVELTPAIQLPAMSIAIIEGKAAANSGKAQPDLQGLMYVTAQGGAVPMELAQALNDLDIVEFVEIEPTYVLKDGPVGACCIDDGFGHFTVCQEISAGACGAAGGVYNGDGTTCPDPDDPACGDLCGGDCFEINNTPICGDEDCCDLVCALDPFCCDPEETRPGRGAPRWDAWCVQHARALCVGAPDLVCGNSNAGPCEEGHPGTVGCSNRTCCESVCAVQPNCCDIAWDAGCAAAALELCITNDPNGTTPNFVPAQGYLSVLSYLEEYGSIPLDIIPGLNFDIDGFLLDGYQGQGYDLQGLWEQGEFLVDNGIGTENLTRGKSIKVGIVEFSAFVSTAIGPAAPYRHEDLHGKVIPEPGQTPIIIPQSGNLNGHHGTATLGIVGAIDDDANGNEEPDGLSPDQSRAEEVGVVGVAPEADLYFFPIVSVEEPGGRLIGAIASAMILFEPGDVLSFSIGPAGCGVLTSGESTWLMIRAASDAGITCCISAGNDCCDLSENPEIGGDHPDSPDSGAVIVGACFPGRGSFNVYCRLGFSNHCAGCGADDGVHVSAWGTSVATLGYGSMFSPNGNLNRSYTHSFGGTSAAAPQVAGLIACLQGYAKQFYGIPILTSQIRDIVSGNGFGQCGFLIPDDRPGNNDDRPCLGDWDFDASKNHIAIGAVAYTEAVTAAVSILSSPLFDCNSLLESFDVLRGTRTYGNINSLRCADSQFFIVKSQFTQPTDNIDMGIVYLSPGHITDVMVVARSDVDSATNLTMNIVTTIVPQGQFTSLYLIFGELYDFNQNRWRLVGFDLVDIITDGPGPFLFTYVTEGGAAGLIREDDNLVLMRVWTLTLGGQGIGGFGGGSPNQTHVMKHDLISVGASGGDGGVVIPP